MRRSPGMKVLVIEDCRSGIDVSGQVGVYEGDFPRGTVVFSKDGTCRELNYDGFVAGDLVRMVPYWCPQKDMAHPLGDGYPVLRGLDPRPPYWFETRNPRIRLPDGSAIWGDECWWGPAEGAPPLEEARHELAEHKVLLRDAIRALHELAENESEL